MDRAVSDAHTLYSEALDATRDQRQQIAEDLRFSDPSRPEQWDEALKRQRETDPGGARPCHVFDQIGQYISNVAGQIQQRPPSMHALPVDSGADKRVAEKLDGFFRHVEHVSRAQQHYARAALSAARVGVGYLTVRPEVVNRALNWQEPRIASEADPLNVVFDPWSVELDGSDATFGYVLTPFSHREFERKWKGRDKVSFADPEKRVRDERESIVVAEEWRLEESTRNMVVILDTQTGDEVALTEDEYWLEAQRSGIKPMFVRTYADRYRCVKWRRMSGAEVLDEPKGADGKTADFPADGIGIVPVYGYWGVSDGRLHYCGMARRAMEPQRAYNFHMSELRALMSSAPKTPWMVPVRAVRGLEALWDRAAADARAWLPYHDVDETGQPINKPERAQVSINLANHVQAAEQALRDIQASLGMYQANLGAPSNETSGVAIDARKEQGEASTAHFPMNLQASVAHVGALTMQMVPRLIDTRRQLRILGIDGTPGSVVIDPQQPEAMRESERGLSINPNVGRYDVRVVVGPAFTTQRGQAQEALNEVMARNPALTPAIAPLWAQTLDIPYADKLAQVLTAVAPPEVRAVLQPEQEGPTTAQLQAQLQQMQQALQEATQLAQEAQAEADAAAKDKEAAEDKLAVMAYEAETKRLVGLKDAITPEQVQALVVQTIEQMMRQPQPLEEPGEMPESYEMQPFPAGAMPETMSEGGDAEFVERE